MHFSRRTGWDLGENAFTAVVQAARATCRELLDLTVSNPTVCGFEYDADALLMPLSAPGALRYSPGPFGMAHAREAVAQYYADCGAEASAAHVCLTTSTSEAYSYLFRLLCDPGDEVLIARPSYPLFDFIARLDDVRLVEYPLLYDHGWHIDLHALKQAMTPRTRAVMVVHPNNPTGNYVSEAERAALEELCAARGVALIVDEVFLDYALSGVSTRSFAEGASSALTFVLSGLSKVCALPQMKLAWMVAKGPESGLAEALGRLEVIADTFLSVSAPTQFAVPGWLAGRRDLQGQISDRMEQNLRALRVRLSGTQAEQLVMQGGWTVVLRVPRHVDGKPFAEAALERGVLVQPGEFYGLAEGRGVLSLLTPSEIWRAGVARLPID